VLTNRLARIIDRSRYLEEQLESPEPISAERAELHTDELSILFRRAKKINRAILLSTSCALLICVVVAGLFIADALNLKLASIIAGTFVLAMVALTGSFIYLLREIWLATEFMNAQQSARLFNKRR
jgi:predicted lysophospholipase L1 biosynthesis ABC-type transport system permease subunit